MRKQRHRSIGWTLGASALVLAASTCFSQAQEAEVQSDEQQARQQQEQQRQQEQQKQQQEQQHDQQAQQQERQQQERQNQQAQQEDDDEIEYSGQERAALGVHFAEGSRGVRISNVLSNSPAEQAGLRRGDRIVRFDDQDVKNYRDIIRRLARKNPEEQTTLIIERDGKQEQINVTLGQRRRVFEDEQRQMAGQDRNRGQWSDERGQDRFQSQWQDQQQRYGQRGQTYDQRDRQQRYGDNRQYQDQFDQQYGQQRWRDERDRSSEQDRYSRAQSRQPMLGISVRPAERGVWVTNVYPGSPADRAGLREGDRIMLLEGQQVRNSGEILNRLRQYRSGDRVRIDLDRNGQQHQVAAQLENQQQIMAGPSEEDRFFGEERRDQDRYQDRDGYQGDRDRWQQDRSQQDQGRWQDQRGGPQDRDSADNDDHPAIGVTLSRQPGEHGVIIREVFEDSPADRIGLRPGDEIVAIGRQRVQSPQSVMNEVNRHDPHQQVELIVVRDGQQRQYSVILARRQMLEQEGFGDQSNEQNQDRQRYQEDQDQDRDRDSSERQDREQNDL